MKLNYIIIAAGILLCLSCSKKIKEGDSSKTAMLLDASYMEDKNVTVINPKDEIMLIESMKDIADNPNIMQTDIDAVNHNVSKEIQYVKKGEEIRLTEK